MVQRSLNAQEQFITDSNRNHSEIMYLLDRNHVEMMSMFNSTIRALTEVGREYVNKM